VFLHAALSEKVADELPSLVHEYVLWRNDRSSQEYRAVLGSPEWVRIGAERGLMDKTGVFYPGEMGTALSRKLVGAGFEVLSCVSGRSERTRINAENNGITLKENIEEVIAESSLVFCLVPPNYAVEVAELVSGAMRKTRKCPLYVDCNSVGPGTMRKIESVIKGCGGEIINGVFIGSASLLESKTTLYLSGERAGELARLLEPALRVISLGGKVGDAAAFKMCFSSFNKGLVALFLEIISAAERVGRREMLLHSLEDFYPGTVETIRRLLPSYPIHCERRIQEMEELVSFLRGLGQVPAMSVGICSVLESLKEMLMEQIEKKGERGRWTFNEIVEICSAGGLLRDGGPKGS
jgi:3-hydroxyisobutyrate dehydrogenase-like beta-hydroxyacid dehydrogenase